MPKTIQPRINVAERLLLESLLTRRGLKHKHAVRVQVLLNRAAGMRTTDIARALHIHPVTVSQWVHRFHDGGVEGLTHDQTRRPGKAPVPARIEKEICRLVMQKKPEAATHWSTRLIAKQVGISHTAVSEILRRHKLRPHLVKKFRKSDDPQFKEKLEDIVGLYLDPPQNSIVLCVDEKSQIQALERMQPILALRPGLPERQTHDYYRNGTTTLFAALDVAGGKVIGTCKPRHRASEYIEFLKLVDKSSPAEMSLHIIVDNVSSHKTKKVKEYLGSRKGRFTVHFTPTHASWLNLIERWFAEITNKRIRRGSWASVKDLERAILEYIRNWNDLGKTFVWTKSAGQILQSIKKATRD
jgi:transposase